MAPSDFAMLMLTQVVPNLVLPVVATLAVIVFRLIEKYLPHAKAAKAAQMLDDARTAVSDVVAAVEQANGSMPGVQKKQIALALISSVLKSRGISVPDAQIDIWLEAAVLGVNATSASIHQALAAIPAIPVAAPSASAVRVTPISPAASIPAPMDAQTVLMPAVSSAPLA